MKPIRSYLALLVFLSAPVLSWADLVITMGGDVNFNKTLLGPSPSQVLYPGGSKASFKNLLSGLRPLINGDLNFANIETVISDKNIPHLQGKAYTFVSHPTGLQEMIGMGFNLFSVANNHAWDAGFEGYQETRQWMEQLRNDNGNRIHFSGIGENRSQALTPKIFEIEARGRRYIVAFAAISFTDPNFTATSSRQGQINLRNPRDLRDFMTAMAQTSAHYKIVSVHTGTESQVTLDQNQRALFRSFVDRSDVDLVIGHHPHVARPVEYYKGRMIFYSLGNYMMPGSADISRRQVGYDYGLFARVYLEWSETENRMQLQAAEALPLTKVHGPVRPISGADGGARVQFLNQLSRQQLGENAAIFRETKNGSGIFCAPNAEISSQDRARAICRVNR